MIKPISRPDDNGSFAWSPSEADAEVARATLLRLRRHLVALQRHLKRCGLRAEATAVERTSLAYVDQLLATPRPRTGS